VRQIQDAHRPVVLTNRGRSVAVIQDLHDYESDVEERAFMKAVVKGIVDLEEGRETSLVDAKNVKDFLTVDFLSHDMILFSWRVNAGLSCHGFFDVFVCISLLLLSIA
jgi:prevent-host-death family protein